MAAVMLRDRRCPRLDFDGSLRAGAAEAGFDLPLGGIGDVGFDKALMDPGARMIVRS
ncbi:hypothetical protein [Streptomyces sp. NPDC001276]|uniref:hypothetical protein n=1 Tax=Streptomyces sp. NPDC001276 TaxID=3364555 RepID=UPI0036B6187E